MRASADKTNRLEKYPANACNSVLFSLLACETLSVHSRSFGSKASLSCHSLGGLLWSIPCPPQPSRHTHTLPEKDSLGACYQKWETKEIRIRGVRGKSTVFSRSSGRLGEEPFVLMKREAGRSRDHLGSTWGSVWEVPGSLPGFLSHTIIASPCQGTAEVSPSPSSEMSLWAKVPIFPRRSQGAWGKPHLA